MSKPAKNPDESYISFSNDELSKELLLDQKQRNDLLASLQKAEAGKQKPYSSLELKSVFMDAYAKERALFLDQK